jgi:hypothetical protein
MKANILKHTGLTEKQFYAKYKTQKAFEDSKEGKAFIKAHGKELKKAQGGTTMQFPSLQQSISNTAPGSCPPGQQKNPLTGICEAPFNYGTPSSPQIQSNLGEGFVRNPETNMYSKPQQYGMTQPKGMDDDPLLKTVSKFAGPAGKLIEGIDQLAQQKKAVKEAKQWNAVSDVSLAASRTSPEEERRRYVRPEDMVINPNQRFPSYGTGTNVLARNGSMIGGNPTEIQNMYSDDDTIYTDLGYEPLNDSSKVKQFVDGGGIANILQSFGKEGNPSFADLGNMGENLGSAAYKNNAGTKIGGSIGGGIGSIFGPAGKAIGQTAGSLIGGALDKSDRKIKAFNDSTMRNVNAMGMQQGIQGVMGQYSSFVRNGGNVPNAEYGWMSHNWNPQVIAKFGDMDVSEIQDYASDGLQSLRTGGHLRQNEQYAMGGELKTHWGGEAETISYNPYLPGTGETIMFRGQSHDESDGQGNTGIGVQYGTGDGSNEANVEVERGEPMIELEQGGEIDPETGEVAKSGNVYGNLIVPNFLLSAIGDPNAKGKKFKNYVADLSKKENVQNKIIDKATNQLNDMEVLTALDITEFNAHKMNIKGANDKLKQYAEFKKNAADAQSAVNDTAGQFGLDADALAKGNTKVDKKSDMYKAMFGKTIPEAEDGKKVKKFKSEKEANAAGYYKGTDGKYRKKSSKTEVTQSEKKSATALPEIPKGQSVNKSSGLYGGVTPEQFEAFKKKHSWYPNWDKFDPNNVDDVDKFAKEFNAKAEKIGSTARILPDSKTKTTKVGKQFVSADLGEDKKTDTAKTEEEDFAEIVEPGVRQEIPLVPAKQNKLAPLYNMVAPFLRQPYQEDLDPNQLSGEMYALSTNQQEPVQAQLPTLELDTPYDVSLQDQLNANQADFNALQRTMGYNPAAQMALAAQKYAANSGVLGEQFRLNQAERSGVYDKNRDLINASKLQNLGILDQQYTRQAMAKSNTKAVTQLALNSISDKIAKNKLENRQLATYSNMFPQYGFDRNMRATNQGLTFFQIPTVGNTEPVYDKKGNIVGYGPDNTSDVATTTTKETTTAIAPTAKFGGVTKKQLRNGDILKSFKNL